MNCGKDADRTTAPHMKRRLLLVGGGHSHVEVIRRWGLAPEPGVTVTLVSPERHASYSGMLPGFIAGHYRFDECHIDLEALCRRAGVTRIEDSISGIDLKRGAAQCGNGAAQPYDILSIDTGSTPVTANIPGADRHGMPVKPVAQFLERWTALRAAALNAATDLRIAVVGAGAGGIEVALAMQYRIRADGGRAQFTMVSDGPAILASHPAGVQRRLAAILRARGIAVRLHVPVRRALPDGLELNDGSLLSATHIVWITGAAAPAWPRVSGLQTDDRGFIAVNSSLQSVSHSQVFAAGDVATMIASPRPKSGVYAVRQGPPLAENLRRALRGESLTAYHPQSTTLALISAGNRYAVASYGPVAFGGAWVWRWKNRIDQAFMRQYKMTVETGSTGMSSG